jgi:putative N6-adenine-specific DNA methylase
MKPPSRRPRHSCYAVCTPGLEALVAAELRALGIRPGTGEPGGVPFPATERQLYAANLFLRTATRVLVRIASFVAPTFAMLEQAAREVPWDAWLAPGEPVSLRVAATASRLYHTGAIAERLAAVVPGVAGPGAAPDAGAGEEEEPPATGPSLRVRFVRDRATVSLDASGEPLYRRGWRLATAKAPLRETLAAALVLASGWDGSTPLVDPLCGSGTIPIEAALLARGAAPGAGRRFAFQRWPSFEPGTWASVRAQAAEQARPARPLVVWAADRDPGAIRAARENAERAGVADAVVVREQPLSALEPPAGCGWLLCNPPYGVRVRGGHDLRDLYATLGRVARERLAGWHVGLLAAEPALAAEARLRFETRLRTRNGGLAVRFLVAKRGGATGPS